MDKIRIQTNTETETETDDHTTTAPCFFSSLSHETDRPTARRPLLSPSSSSSPPAALLPGEGDLVHAAAPRGELVEEQHALEAQLRAGVLELLVGAILEGEARAQKRPRRLPPTTTTTATSPERGGGR